MTNHYDALGIASTATPKEIKAAWRRLSAKYHPDREGGDDAAMQEINAAYDVLSDPQRRALYDQLGFDTDVKKLDEAAAALVADTFGHIIDEPGDFDLVVRARSILSQGRTVKAEEESRLRQAAYALERKRDRVRLRKDAQHGKRDLYGELIAGRIRTLQAVASQASLGLVIVNRALELLTDYEGTGPAVVVPSHRPRFNPYQNTTADHFGGWGR